MINHKLILEKIAAIEQSFDVNSVRYKDLLVWPLVRVAIYQQLCHPEKTFHRNYFGHKFKYSIQEKEIKSLQAKEDTDILLLSRSNEYEYIKGKYYNQHIDSMIDLIKDENYSFLKIENNSKQSQSTFPRLEPTIIINPIAIHDEVETIHSIDNFSALQKVILEIANIHFDEGLFVNDSRIINLFQALYTEVLSAIKPKVVFLVCYYYNAAMALIRACKKLDIKTVDIQHGAYGDYHAAYTHWTTIPSEGYDLLPDFFWCWGRTSTDSIVKWYSCKTHHIPLVGSNLSIAKWTEANDPVIDSNFEMFYDRLLKKKEKVVIIAMSYHDTPLPDHVFEAMRCSPPDWLWLIRMHPTSRTVNEKERLSNIFRDQKINNFEIEYATYCPLYGLLKRCDHVVILWSSVFYEALAFHVPTTIIDPSGLQYYEDDIKKGILTYADTSDKLLTYIRQGFSKLHQVNPSDYIETDRQCAKSALQRIFKKEFQSSNHDISNNYEMNNPDSTEYANTMNKLGTDFSNRGFIKAALNCFIQSIESNPNFTLSYNNLGVLYCHTGELNKAIKYFVKALEISPHDQRIVSNVIEFLKIVGNIQSHKKMTLLF